MEKWLKAYPAVFEQTNDKAYSVFFPDIAGCVSAGDTLEEAIEMSKEALSLHLSEMINDNDECPAIDLQNAKQEAEGCILMMIEPNAAIISRRTKDKAVRINITIPQFLLESVDNYVKAAHTNRSRLIAETLQQRLSV
jgi:predicted RNase H-like HicB family nuclease